MPKYMPALKNFPLYAIIVLIAFILAFEARIYLHHYYDLLAREQAVNTSIHVRDRINFYNSTMETLYAFKQADNVVSKDEVQTYLKMWKDQNELGNLAISYYGIYGALKEGDENVNFFGNYNNENLLPNVDSKTLYEQLKKYSTQSDFIFLERHLKEKNSHIFMAIDFELLKKEINNIVEKDQNKFNAITLIGSFPGLRKASIYHDEILLGNQTITVHYLPKTGLQKKSFEDIISTIVFFTVLGAFLSLFWAFRRVISRAKASEIQKSAVERKLEQHSDLFNKMIENLPGVLFVKDAKDDYRMFMVNKAAEKFFGYTREQMLGKTDHELWKEEEANFFHTIDLAVMDKGDVVDIPCEILTTPDGEMFCHTKKVPIYDENGNPQYLVGLLEDITSRKHNEIELANYRENLENIVSERTEKLKKAIKKAEEANRLKSEFLATMSHEIRSPMSGVIGMAELLLDTPLTSEQKGMTKTILNSGEVLLNIIEDILDFSKIEANKLELDPIAVNMLEIVDDVALLYSTKARDKALELAVRYVPGSEQFVYADPVRIRQVLGNLINNAIKFTESGYVIVTVREDSAADMPEDKVRLTFSVQDTGIGIEEKDQERIFDKFSQANSSTTRNYGGTGLGLSICRKLVELMGGEICLQSVPSKGSVFEFTLPMTRNREEVYVQPQPPILKDRRVMIVDDLPVIRTMVMEQLSGAGMICDSAENGHEALAKLVEARDDGKLYDIIIIDYLMPGMNGEMLARAINDEPAFRDICLIMLTAAGNPMVTDEYAEKGFSAYMSKPVRSRQLIETLAMVWKKYSDGYKDTLIRVDAQSLGNITREDKYYKLTGTHILLVEDSRLNQAFAEEVLSQLSCDITTVSNGQEALDIVQKERFDLILMDCQMPVMDGFEASRKICALKKQGVVAKNLPIIALTANAMKGDKQRCMEAGMDDYITKPVRKNELKEKIYSWIKNNGQPIESPRLNASENSSIKEQAEMTTILDAEILNEARLILKDKFDFMLDCYIEDVENYIHEIQEALIKHDLEALVRPAHTIKSTSKRMGALYLSDVAKDIELAAREAANNNAPDLWTTSAMVEKIKSINSIFEKTRDHLLQTRAQ